MPKARGKEERKEKKKICFCEISQGPVIFSVVFSA